MTPTEPDLLPRPRRAELTDRRVPWAEPAVGLDSDLPAQGYRLTISDGAVTVDAADAAGEFYARTTLSQLRRTHGGSLPVGSVTDWPDLPIRGVLLDVSRDKVPTMPTLIDLVDQLAGWKINQIQLYTEHTFAYAGHEEVWRDASPLTADEIGTLDAVCRERYVELVPNQNCLGHMDRWLRHPRYGPLALAPEGSVRHGLARPASTLNPADPASLDLVRDLLGQLLPNFTSSRIHVGLDEPWELPADRFDDYLGWLRALRALPELEGREMLVWGDILAEHPDSISDLPDGVTVCDWGYEDHSPFEGHAAVFDRADRPFWTSPGTSAWTSILGRVTNMRGNCANAAAAALAHGGRGMLITDWGDLGHLQYPPVSDPGFAYGAAVAWGLEANRDLDLARALSVHCYDDPTLELGAAVVELGDVSRIPRLQVDNMSSLALPLYYPQFDLYRGPTAPFDERDVEGVLEALETGERRIARAAARRTDAEVVSAELTNAIALVRLLANDAAACLASGGSLGSVPETERRALEVALESVVSAHRSLWHLRSRPGGYADSERWLTHFAEGYRTGERRRDWPGSG